jgi:hypothetical protein
MEAKYPWLRSNTDNRGEGSGVVFGLILKLIEIVLDVGVGRVAGERGCC